MNGPDGQAVNALTVPYAVLSTSLRLNGRVSLGDVGLAIRVATGKASGFLFADAGGTDSVSVGECLEPISKSPEEDEEASELDEAEEVLRVILPTDEDAALPPNPGEEALDEP